MTTLGKFSNMKPTLKYIGADIEVGLRKYAALALAQGMYIELYASRDKVLEWSPSVKKYKKNGDIDIRIIGDFQDGSTTRIITISAEDIYNYYEVQG